jgi:hypothetical protein
MITDREIAQNRAMQALYSDGWIPLSEKTMPAGVNEHFKIKLSNGDEKYAEFYSKKSAKMQFLNLYDPQAGYWWIRDSISAKEMGYIEMEAIGKITHWRPIG